VAGIGSRYADGIKQYYDTTIEAPPHYLKKMQSYYNSVVLHGKGYSIISTLDCILGNEIFDRIVRRSLKEYAGLRLGASEFQIICEQESQQDLNWFFDPWLRSNTFPSYQITSQECQEDKNIFISKVTVDCFGTLKIPVPVLASFEDGSRQLKFTDQMLDKNFIIFESTSPLQDVVLDPDTVVALVNPPPPGDFDSLVELNQRIQKLPWTGAGEKSLIAFREASKAGMKSALLWYRLGLLLYDGTYNAEALKAFDYALAFNDGNAYISFIAYTWKGHLFDLLDNREEALEFYAKAIEAYPGSPVSHSQYNMKIDKTWLEERLQKPFKR
jgi:tetratricopeptide (TPR) repeat protein